MQWPSGFGINIACYRGDYPFAKACCSSLRRHLGDVPVDLYVDGSFSVASLANRYGVRPIYRRDISHAGLRDRSFGYGLTKMIVLWESRFERFLYLDADTVLWGNPFEGLDLEAADVIHNEPHEPYTEFILKSQYFDYDRIFASTRTFDWQGRHYFNTGVFVARRGCLDLDEYFELLDLKASDSSLLPTGEQGILNLLVFRAVSEGRLTVAEAPLQTVITVVPLDELTRRFRVGPAGPDVKAGDRTVLHWAGPKPYSMRSDVFRAPMAHYRVQALREAHHPLRWLAPLPLIGEDLAADRRQALPVAWRSAIRKLRRPGSAGVGG